MMAAHRSPLAGSWYPAGASELKQLLAGAIEDSVARTGAFVRPGGVAFIVPHAAPLYSGTVAASVYRHVQATGATRVVILGFSHRRPVAGIGVPEVEEIETPLGKVPVDRALAGVLAGCAPFHPVAEEAVCDHSVEIQLPFLQTLVPGAAVVPLYVGALSDAERAAAAVALRDQMDARTVLIASSDLTHYGRDFGYQPFRVDDSTAAGLRALDGGVLAAAGSLDPRLFVRQLRQTGATVCGAGPIGVLLDILGGCGREVFQETLDYDTSGAMVHDFRHSVSYGAVGYFPAEAYWLEPADQTALLAGARYALDQFRRTGCRRFREETGRPSLLQRGRAFVTLYREGSVRGCVGCFDSACRLAEGVPRLTLDSLADGRFGRVREEEELEIEVHLLTPPKRIASREQLKVGEHGACLKAGRNEGLLLPMVATRRGFDSGEFLAALARKAGIDESVYSGDGWELSIFRDQSFRERPV